MLGEHQALLRAAWAEHGGAEVDTQGDSFFVAFARAPDAVAAAAAGQRGLAAHEWPEDAPVHVRMGVHTGTVQLMGSQYVGLDMHRAARIAAAGHGGQVLLSQTTRDLAEHSLPEGATLRDLGAHRLKDLQHAEHLYQLVLPGLPADFPPLRTLDARRHNLAVQPTPLLGRDEAVAAICLLLRDGARLVTLTGLGGIGKTRLSIQVAAELLDDFPNGVWFVRLSRLTDSALVLPTIAQTLGLREQGGTPIAETLREYVRAQHLLLVLDNFEQVIGAADDIARLLEACPRLRALVTSRTPLRLRGEKAYAVAPLPLAATQPPPTPERVAQYAAVALFIERARDAQADFAVTAANAPAIAEVCARLDGLPLAIELAVARVRLLPPEALLARLSSRLLTGGTRDAEDRQRTMHAAIAWSEQLLTPEERTLFRRLAVFASGCTLEAAEAVCAAPEGAEPLGIDVLDGVAALVDHSLVQSREEGGEARFSLLHVIREYALEQLEASDGSGGGGEEAEALRRTHADHFLALAESAEPELTGPEVGAWLDRLEGEHDNLRAALDWARERGETETALRLVAALCRFWWTRGHLREGRAWVEGLLARDGAEMAPERVRARALVAGGVLVLWQGDVAAAEPWLEVAAALGRRADDRRTAALALHYLGVLANQQRDLERAAARLAESLALLRPLGDRHGIAMALTNLANVAVYQGDLERAEAAYAEALALSRQAGDRGSVAGVLLSLGWAARQRGELTQAEALGREGLALARELGDARLCAEAVEHLASTAGAAGQKARAARLLGAAAAVRESLDAPQLPPERADTQAAVAASRAALGEEVWAAAFAAGRALSLEEAVAEALGEAG